MFIQRLAIALVFILLAVSTVFASVEEPQLHIDLGLSFTIEKEILHGTAKITIPANQDLLLHLGELEITASILSEPGKENQQITISRHPLLHLEKTTASRVLYLSYRQRFGKSYRNIISEKAIILTSDWHPVPDRSALYSLNVHLPAGFSAVSESDTLGQTKPDGTVQFHFSQAVRTISLAAGPYIKQTQEVRPGLRVHTMFFPEENHLAGEYLDAAAGYIKRYEQEIGPFPYNHYLIVENLMPTGFGMPTFTLLGKQVIRLPFIKNTALGHEILHSWFGNSIEPDYRTGNWSEGLTTFLADMAYRNDAGENVSSRKEKIKEFLSYVTDTTPPLQQFVSAGHNSTAGRAERAVGYGRSAMLFHELKKRVGTSVFTKTVQLFYRNFKGKTASWTDIRELFEQESGLNLKTFFSQRLTSNALPELSVSHLQSSHNQQNHTVSFHLNQDGTKPYELLVPFVIRTTEGEYAYTQLISEKTTEVTCSVNDQPLELIVDPDYHLMRVLNEKERYPAWSEVMGSKDVLIILSDVENAGTYAPFIQFASRFSWQVSNIEALTSKDLEQKDLIFLGTHSIYRGLYGPPQGNDSKTGFSLEVKYHPIHQNKTITLVTSSYVDETKAAVSRLTHYGKYAYLAFSNGTLSKRRISFANNGIHHVIEAKPYGFRVSDLTDFDGLTEALENYQVIYLGEQHTSRADHLLQLMVIEAMYKKNPDLAIGMEMFPQSSQDAIDNYIFQDRIDEKTFLRESGYYNVWRFDYRLFRPIISFAKRNRIPVIALNLDGSIVSDVYKNGGMDNLSVEQKATLPENRALDLPGYTERLQNIYDMHTTFSGTGGSFEDFVNSQSLWDEFMARSITTFARKNPTTKLIVLAGSQHTRKDSGIPPRVARRLDIPQASVINLASSPLSGKEIAETADFAFFFEATPFTPQGKIGVVLEETTEDGVSGLKIVEISSPSHATPAGLVLQDIITKIETTTVSDMEDIRIAMFDKTVGEKISIMVKRKNNRGTWEEHICNVEIINPQKQASHP